MKLSRLDDDIGGLGGGPEPGHRRFAGRTRRWQARPDSRAAGWAGELETGSAPVPAKPFRREVHRRCHRRQTALGPADPAPQREPGTVEVGADGTDITVVEN